MSFLFNYVMTHEPQTQSPHCGRQVMAIAQVIQRGFGGRRDLSGLGGVETGRDAAEFLLLGANSVQVNPSAQGVGCIVDVSNQGWAAWRRGAMRPSSC